MIFPTVWHKRIVRSTRATIKTNSTYMVCHIAQGSLPFDYIEVLEAKPGVTVVLVTTPAGFGDVVVKVHVDLLFSALFRNRVEDLRDQCVSIRDEGRGCVLPSG